MNPSRELWTRLLGVFRRGAANRRIEEESLFHLDMLTEKYMARGLSKKDARIAARREFGGVTQMQDEFRDQSSLPFFDALRSDLVFAARSFAKTPGLTLLIIVTLGLGIGANTAIFSFMNELLLRPLPFRDPQRLMAIARSWRGAPGATTPHEFALIRDKSRSFDAVGTMFLHRGANVETGGEPQHVTSLKVSEGYFRVLGMEPLMGRTFSKDEDVPNGPSVVVLSHALWQSAFHSDPAIVGRAIKIGGIPHLVVGVMPDRFSARTRAKIWMPLQTAGQGNDSNYTMIGRLANGVTPKQAAAEVDSLFYDLDMERSKGAAARGRDAGIVISLGESEATEFRQPVLLLYGGVCVLLFVACLNVASLLLSRSAARAREVALRAALGAGRGRIIRQMLTESTLLAGLGCGAGLLIAYGLVMVLTKLLPYAPLKDTRLDAVALAFTVIVSFVVGIAFGLAPAWHSMRLRLNETLKATSGNTSLGASALLGRMLMVAGQVALCTILLNMAGLLVHTIMNLRAVEVGFDPRNVMIAPMTLNADKMATKESHMVYYQQVLDRLHGIPGVSSVAVTTQLPVEGQMNLPVELPESAEPQRRRSMQFRAQTREAFQVFGMRIVRGGDFRPDDRAGSPPVAVVNEAFARAFFPGQEVMGKRITLSTLSRLKMSEVYGTGVGSGKLEWTIVGVVNDVREIGLRQSIPPVMYTLVDQVPHPVMELVHSFVSAKWVIRTQPGMGDLNAQLRQVISLLDPSQPFEQTQSMDSMITQTMQMERFLTMLLSAFALLTLVMVASGLYGTLSYSVLQRRKEISIRMALGAGGWNVIGMVMRSGLGQVGAGLIIGMLASYWVTRLMTGFLFHVPAFDPVALAGSCLLLLLVSAIAGSQPAFQAVHTDPLQTLRAE